MDPAKIISQIGLITGKPLEPGKTILFLDEIQKNPKAIMALRYFHEQMPGLHVIAAGSLLEFALEAENFSFPVGRVDSLFLHPMSFLEFLEALGKKSLADWILSDDCMTPAKAVHDELMELVRRYWIIGGMPEAVRLFVETGDLARVTRVHDSILQNFRDDFGKYANRGRHPELEKVFQAAPRQSGSKFQYKRVDPESGSRELKQALALLVKAGVLRQVFRTSAGQPPLAAGLKPGYFKLLGLDIGLMTTQIGLGSELLRSTDMLSTWNGAVAEQFVGQEITAYSSPYRLPELFYWGREESTSQAEIDYIIQKEGKVFPIEVKSNKAGQLKSLNLFLEKYGTSGAGLRFCARPYKKEDRFTSWPLYAVIKSLIPQ